MKLRQALRGKLTDFELPYLVTSFDVVGHVAIITIPQELEEKEILIAETILGLHKNIQVVTKRVGAHGGEFRTVSLKIIAGAGQLETEHKENGVRFVLDPSKVYFSIRLSTERKRVARLAKADENILVLFSGIGAFGLVIAANSSPGQIVGIEKNPIAHDYALQSLKRNKKIKNVSFVLGSVEDQLPMVRERFDRILIPHPKSAHLYIDKALAVLKPGGTLHFYSFRYKDTFCEAVEQMEAVCVRNKRRLVQSQITVCGHCGTRLYRICVDAEIK